MPETPAIAALAALRERGIDRRDPVRFRLAEALARRASAHSGAARTVIDAKLAALLRRLSDGARDARPEGTAGVARGPLGALVDGLAHRRSTPWPGTTSLAGEDRAPEANTLQFFKRTWSRLSAEQRLAQSSASLPDNAGPLNSQHLVHRSLTLMHALSPEYLAHFVGYIDALQWLERADEASVRPGGPARR